MGEWTWGELDGDDAERARRFMDKLFGAPLAEGQARTAVVTQRGETIPCPHCKGSGELYKTWVETEYEATRSATFKAFWRLRKEHHPLGDNQVVIEELPDEVDWWAWADGDYDEPGTWKYRRPTVVDRILDGRG